MDRARRRIVLPVAALALVATPLLLGAPVYGSAPPVVTFRGGGPAPLVCTSRPDVSSVSVDKGQRVVLANLTGADATLDLGSGSPLTIANGDGVSVKLSAGTHRLRLVPKCLLVGEVREVVVDVDGERSEDRPDAPRPSGTPTESPPIGGASPPPGSTATGGAGPTWVAEPGSTGAPEIGAGPAAGGGAEVEPVAIDRPRDDRGPRLLAIVAAICAFGVTAGIIRAIVTYRARRVGGIRRTSYGA